MTDITNNKPFYIWEGIYDTLPMDNFLEAYRLAQTMHLVFQRKN